jgi:hypothetical protein
MVETLIKHENPSTYNMITVLGFLTFNNITVLSWLSVLLVVETRMPRENHY